MMTELPAGPPALKTRSAELRLGREFALRVLYAEDLNHLSVTDAWARCRGNFLDEEHPGLLERTDPLLVEAERIAVFMLEGVRRQLAEIDGLLGAASKRWKPSRMPVIDRNILRLCTFELLDGQVPPRDVIFDAVDLAKRFGDGPTSRFVNGILDQICRDRGIRL